MPDISHKRGYLQTLVDWEGLSQLIQIRMVAAYKLELSFRQERLCIISLLSEIHLEAVVFVFGFSWKVSEKHLPLLMFESRALHRTFWEIEMAKKYPVDFEAAARTPSSRASKRAPTRWSGSSIPKPFYGQPFSRPDPEAGHKRV